MKIKVQRSNIILISLKLSIILSALDAISIGSIPLTWIANWLPILVVLLLRPSLRGVPIYFYMLILWAVAVQIISIFCFSNGLCANLQMPLLSTTPYPIYIILRFIPFLMLVSVVVMLASIKERIGEIYNFALGAGVCVALIAMYVYFAHQFGFPDIPRTRLGTDGLEVTSVSFSYSFHRALGTFREPSGMAAWLMLPFFLSLFSKSWYAFLIGGVILLSGSMSVYVAVFVGLLFVLLFVGFKNPSGLKLYTKLTIKIFIIVFFSFFIFVLFVNKSDDYQGLLNVVNDRLMPVLIGGVEESNRGYVYDFAADVGIPLIGFGLGNINLILTSWLGGDAVAGILSLYLNIIMSLGVIGLFLLFLFLLQPITKKLKMSSPSVTFACYGSYFSWLVIFIIHSAEFPLMFAITYGLISGIDYIKPSMN